MRALIAGSGPLLTVLLACVVWAQPTEAPTRAVEPMSGTPAPAENGPSKPAIVASKLDTFLLRDSKGNLVPVLGMSFEEFERLLKIKRGLAPAAPPEYSIDALAVTGTVTGDVAHLQAVATVRVREPSWVRIPLRLNQAILRKAAEHTGKGESFVTCEAEGDGYLCWIKEGSEQPEEAVENETAEAHQVKLQFAVPLEAIGDERRLALTLPRATEASLKLEVPLEKIEAALRSGGDGLLASRPLGSGKSEVSLLGAAGDLQISWRPGRDTQSASEAIEAVGEVLVKVEGRTRVSSEVKLRLRSHTKALESVQVRVPPGMELTPSTVTGYSVAVVSSANEESAPQLVEVKLDRPASGPTEVRLTATLASRPRGSSSLEPAAWEVVGAVRQRGTVDVAVDGDWLLQWTEDASVRRVDTPVDSVAAGKIAARFEYFRQPCHLKLQVSARPTRVSVEPTYIVYVDADQTRLEAKLRYRIRGTRAQNLVIDAAGWEFDRISPEAFFATDSGPINDDPWRLPLAIDAPAEMEVDLDAHQASSTSDGMMQFALPRPQADLATPATLIVVPADNVELIPDAAGTRGLTVDTLPPGVMLPVRQQAPLVYRDLGGVEAAQLAARFRLRERKTAVSTETVVQIDQQRMQVTQKLHYRIAHEPQRIFELAIPTELQRASGLSIAFGDQILPLEPVSEEASQPSASAYRFVAPRDLIGPCEFVVKCILPTPALPSGESTSISIPLAIPVDRDESEFSNHSLVVRYSDDLKLDSLSVPNDAKSGPAEFEAAHETQLTLLHPISHADVVVSTIARQQSAAVAIQRAWVQSWISESGRQDRAVWRLVPREPVIRLRLPGGTDLSAVQVALNGRPVDRVARERELFAVPLPPGTLGKEQVLELWYSVGQVTRRPSITRERLEAPIVENGTAAQRLYWQLCLPAQYHLLAEPEGFAAELGWKWRGMFWARQATITQSELEEWTGASQQPGLPESVNTYVFSSLGAGPPITIVSASQRLLLATFSVGALAICLAFVYIRQLRTPAVLLIVSFVLLFAAMWAPELTLYVGQAIALGIAVALVSVFGWWLTTGRSTMAPAAPALAAPSLEPKSTQMPTVRSERPSPSTTAASPLGIAAESRS